MGRPSSETKTLFEINETDQVSRRHGSQITPYLTLGPRVIVDKRRAPISDVAAMEFGNKPTDGGYLLVEPEEIDQLGLTETQKSRFLRRIYGSHEYINSEVRYCVWVEDKWLQEAQSIASLAARIEGVRKVRLASRDKGANALAKRAHQLKLMRIGRDHCIVVPAITSENRPYLPCGLIDQHACLSNKCFGLYDAPLWTLALVATRLHWVWIGTVCVRLEMRFSYSNTLGWNTFPVPPLSDQNKADLTRCAEEILLAREAHFPATIADLYDPKAMPADLRAAHDRNDETLERIYIGRRFKNDTERLEKLFEMYTQMTAKQATTPKKQAKRKTKGAEA